MIDQMMITTLGKAEGIVEVKPFSDQDRQKVLEIEEEAQKRSMLGLGKVFNSGVRVVLNCELIYVALTNMDFSWDCHPSLVLKKDQEIVGEEIRDKEVIARLSTQKNVWFMHENFVVYKDKMSFPKDLKICHFDIPPIPVKWCTLEDDKFRCQSIMYANPAPPCDLYLKNQYFGGLDEKGLGTILMGVKL